MKILVVVELYFHKNKSGGEAYLHHFLKKIKEYTEATINILIPNKEEDKKYDFEGIIINEVLESDEELDSYILEADILVSQLMLSPTVIKYSDKYKKPLIWLLHGFFEGFTKFMKNNKIIKIFNSKNVLVDFSNKSNYIIQNYHIIYPFTDFDKLSKFKDKEIERREYITFINPVQNKGAELVIQIAKKNLKRKFLIVEGGYSHQEQKQYLTEFRNLSNCHIIKNTNDIINEIYLKSRIVLMPSKYESYGMVASEASCLGIPVIINREAKGLNENLGKLSLGGHDHDFKSYQRIIESLDIFENYFMWSHHYFDLSEERKDEIEFQFETFLESHFTLSQNQTINLKFETDEPNSTPID